jgi:hypothetical protein
MDMRPRKMEATVKYLPAKSRNSVRKFPAPRLCMDIKLRPP